MASEIEKFSVFDPRIVQTRPKYAVEKGALSLSTVPVSAQTADSSSCQFNVQVPSENVFIDRAVEWHGTQCVSVTVTLTAVGTVPVNTPLAGLVAPAAFPLHQSVTQMSATINDATVTVNTQDVLPQILRLSDLADARRQRTCPTMLDRYAVYPNSSAVKNSPLLAWDEVTASDEVPNGGFQGFYYATSATGKVPQPVSGAGTTVSNVKYINGQPYLAADLVGTAIDLTFHVCYASVEKLMLPPFIFTDQYEWSTGLFGVQNFQVQMNLAPTSNVRSVRVSTTMTVKNTLGADAGTFSAPVLAWSTTGEGGGMWVTKPKLSVQFLTPALDVPLPPKSIVPYMEFPRYISTPATQVDASATLLTAGTPLSSNTITLPNIPDLLVIYVKPSSYADATQGDWSLPITGISMNFDNFSGLLSTTTQQQLYQMSIKNGLDMDWAEWSGLGRVPSISSQALAGTIAAPAAGKSGQVGLVGGPLVLRPGRDFALSSGMAPGLVGNFTLQFNITCQNFTGSAQASPNIYVVPISSGFFETIKGSSRVIKGVLTEQDILSAPAQAPSADADRPVGAGLGGAMGGRRHGGAMGGAMGGRHGGRHGGAHGGMKAYM